MSLVHKLSDVPADRGPVVLAIGFFDGVHLGHRKVIERAIVRSRELSGQAWVLTFEPHPLKVINPASAPPLLTPGALKIRHILEAGPAGCVALPFTPALAQCGPDEFIARLAGEVPRLASISVGPNWRFGRGAAGDVAMLKQFGAQYGFTVDVVEPYKLDDRPVSSTRIREAVLAGDLPAANAMLGRPYSIGGAVVPGRRIGHQLGFPTANLSSESQVWPPPGVYAVVATVDARPYAAAAYFGRRPTFETDGSPILEVHFFDVRLDLYGRDIEVFFLHRLRGDTRFPSVEELKAQIAADIRMAKDISGKAVETW